MTNDQKKQLLNNRYLTEQLITYIGNKRKLLPLIDRAITLSIGDKPDGARFVDLFAGSGVVSRFAKTKGFSIVSNDWEKYSSIINYGYLVCNQSDIKKIFGSEEKWDELIDSFNNLDDPAKNDEYIANYYSSHSNDPFKSNYKKERLFYTRQNGLIIDKIRNKIEELFPICEDDPASKKIRSLLLASLLYKASKHTNTSGVFKACHKGFGGFGKDALSRILAPIQLEKPVLVDSPWPIMVTNRDANELIYDDICQGSDIVYMDPPYNQHQYGSNYHMLNTIAKWDKIPQPLEYKENGELIRKAAIREDWKETRSKYCYKKEATDTFKTLIRDIDSRHLLISYSTDGIIPFDTMRSICQKKGNVKLVSNKYTTYRGGKQSNSRRNSNIEFIMMVNTKKKHSAISTQEIEETLVARKVELLLKEHYSPSEIKKQFDIIGESAIFKTDNGNIEIDMYKLYTANNILVPESILFDELSLFCSKLSKCILKTKEDQLETLFNLLDHESDNKQWSKMVIEFPKILKKIASKKDIDRYKYWRREIEKHYKSHKVIERKFEVQIEKLDEIANKRFSTSKVVS